MKYNGMVTGEHRIAQIKVGIMDQSLSAKLCMSASTKEINMRIGSFHKLGFNTLWVGFAVVKTLIVFSTAVFHINPRPCIENAIQGHGCFGDFSFA